MVAVIVAATCVTAQLVPSRAAGWTAPGSAVAVVAAAWLAGHTGTRRSGLAAVVAAAISGLAVLVAAIGPHAALVTVAGVGLATAAAVDLVEHRIPTPVAHGTTVVSALGVAIGSVVSGSWRTALGALGATAVVVAVYAVLWLAGGVGFGDVRLAAATLTAGTGGPAYVSLMLVVPIALVGAAGLLLATTGRRGPLPLGPALVAAWLVALGTSR
jgi:leader peptidase (prepilin peptidase)/N-methyltransferase